MSRPSSVSAELDAVLAAALRLPVCDDAAKLHALIERVLHAVDGGLTPAAEALAVAAAQALNHDPWVQFELAARRFHACSADRTQQFGTAATPCQTRLGGALPAGQDPPT